MKKQKTSAKSSVYIILALISFSFVTMSQKTPTDTIQKSQLIYLWNNGAPGFENRKNEPEEAKDWWVKNIHNPSITAYFPPKDKNTGAAVLICPGGGHSLLVINGEGTETASYFNSLGITAFVLKYRLAREKNSPYTIEKHVRADAYRAIRTIRSKAKDWSIDPNRVGVIGFSAGGEVAALVCYTLGEGNPKAIDPIERYNGKPDFQILIYPGPLGIPKVVPSYSPPVFMLAANDDECCSAPILSLMEKYRKAKIPAELHLFSQGDHAFNMGNRSKLNTIKGWPQRMADWFVDNHYFIPNIITK